MTEYERKIIAYRMAVSLAKSMLKQGIITAEEYAEIDTIMERNTAYLRVLYFVKSLDNHLF